VTPVGPVRPMKVLLTGANGFVGSHILDCLVERGIGTAVLLRPGSDRRLISGRLAGLDIRTGSISEPASLDAALEGVSHVIHCAGSTKAVRLSGFREVNQAGTRRLVDAINRRGGAVRRLVHVSSLAAAGPASRERPALEDDPPHPVSEYGRSKLAGEEEVRSACRAEFVIVRPPAVYGPRDEAFLPLFKAVAGHVRPLIGGGRMPLSLVYVRDLAEAIVACLDHPAAAGRTYFAACGQIVTSGGMAAEIASRMNTWTIPLCLPAAALWPACAAQELLARITRRPAILSLQKFAELTAPGWTCSADRLGRELGIVCATNLQVGVARTLEAYRAEGRL
jgi:nucleoside-diphosphate-sugar epimerase